LNLSTALNWSGTPWALASGVAVLVALLCWGAWLTVSRERNRIELRAQARRAERERIARDLHDTLLQRMQAVLLKFQTLATDDRLIPEVRSELAAVAEEARFIATDVRERIKALRQTETPAGEITDGLKMLGRLAPMHSPARYRVETHGPAQPLRPETHAILLAIACEAVQNAYQHAQASCICLRLEYSHRGLTLTIADNGHGTEAVSVDTLVASGHFGLIGMHERAAQLGATLTLDTAVGRGCRIELRVAPKAAFTPQRFNLRRDAATQPIVCHTQPATGRGATSCNETSLPTQRPRISPT
jgi:signal transduction histidine kinase